MKIFLNSDAPGCEWLLLVVATSEGGIYEHQTRGLLTELRSIQGVGIPCNGGSESVALQQFCERHGLSYGSTGSVLSSAVVDELADLVGAVTPVGDIVVDGDYDEVLKLKLDRTSMSQIVEGWIPVIYGTVAGVLLFPNSD